MRIIISHQLPPDWVAPVTSRYETVIGRKTTDSPHITPELRPHFATAEGLLTLLTVRVDDDLLDQMPNLRVISQMAVGVDNIDLQACTRRGIPVGHTPDVVAVATAEIALTLLLSVARRLPEAVTDAREGRWGTWSPTAWLGANLMGATLGIIGMGAIGLETARRAQAFGMKIVYHSRTAKPAAEAVLGARRLSLEEVLRESDVVSLHVPFSAETHHLINPHTLALMKPTAILINTARGGVVDTDALTHALQAGQIWGAGLDVTDPEPLPPTHPLYRLPNCLITPHIGTSTEYTRRRMAQLACDNLLAGLAGRPLPHCANPTVNGSKNG